MPRGYAQQAWFSKEMSFCIGQQVEKDHDNHRFPSFNESANQNRTVIKFPDDLAAWWSDLVHQPLSKGP